MSAATVKFRESILGPYATILAGRQRYPVTILFSPGRSAPTIVHGGSLTPIDDPSRFGATWDDRKSQRAYMRAFIADWDRDMDRWDAIPCSVCHQAGDPCACA